MFGMAPGLRTRRTLTLLLTLAIVAGVFVALSWRFIERGFSPRLPPAPADSTVSRTDPEMPVQVSMQQSSERLLEVTRAPVASVDGGKRLEMRYDAARGWQPVWNFPIDVAQCSELATAPAFAWHDLWRTNPESFVQQCPKTYARWMRERSPVLKLGREPLLAEREAMALTGQREHVVEALGPEFLVYVNDTKKGEAGTWITPLHVPYNAVLEFDRVAWTLTSVFERNAYPYILHLCADYLESQGVQWDCQVPAPFSDGFAGDPHVIEHWAPEALPGLGRALYDAVRTSSDMDSAFLGARHDIFQNGAARTPFRGGGLGPTIGALLWGEHFESYFHGDSVLAAKTAVFLAANTKARIQHLPDSENGEPPNSQKESNGAYVTRLANTWFTLGVINHPTMAVFLELPLGYGEDDLSYNWIRFMKEYMSRVLPMGGQFKVYDPSELQAIIRTANLLPYAFVEQSVPRFPH